MFMLHTEDLIGGCVLDVAGGASSFTADARRLGIFAEAADPLYDKSSEEIAVHGFQEIDVVAAKMEKLKDVYDWSYYGSVERHKAGRIAALERFLQDYENREETKRYHQASLPSLPFDDNSFELVLCSHFLFLYEEQFDFDFHLAAVGELLRVCKPGGEVRIYPLLSFKTAEYSRLPDLIHALGLNGNFAQKRDANLPFLPNSHQFLSISKPCLA
jgi:hypothetical protein